MQKYNPRIEVHKYLLPWCVILSSSTSKGQEISESSRSSWKDLLELLENEIRGELLDDIFIPKYFLVSSFPRENNCNRQREIINKRTNLTYNLVWWNIYLLICCTNLIWIHIVIHPQSTRPCTFNGRGWRQKLLVGQCWWISKLSSRYVYRGTFRS